MRHDLQTAALGFVPLMLATLAVVEAIGRVGVSEPAAEPTVRHATAAAALFSSCRASHGAGPVVLQHRGGGSERSQSPDWLRRQHAEIEACLRGRTPETSRQARP
jgi:hypothetical protein